MAMRRMDHAERGDDSCKASDSIPTHMDRRFGADLTTPAVVCWVLFEPGGLGYDENCQVFVRLWGLRPRCWVDQPIQGGHYGALT